MTLAVRVPLDAPVATLEEAREISRLIAVSNLLPEALRGKPADVLVIVLYGRELNLNAMQSIQGIYVVKGKPQLAADTWAALIRRAGHRIEWGVRDGQSATVTVTRGDDSTSGTETFTVQDALAAKLIQGINPDGTVKARSARGDSLPWENFTKRMLSNRALSFCGKLMCPEVALGFGVEGDYDYVDESVEVTTVTLDGVEQVEDPVALAAKLRQAQAEFIPADGADGYPVMDADVVPDDPEADLFAKLDEQAAKDLG